MHAFHQCIRDFIMGKMSPPNQHIRRGEQGLREALFSFIQGCCTNCPTCSGQPLGECSMHTVRVLCRYVWVCSLMTKLIPNSDLRHGYSVDPFVSQTAQHLSALSVLISAANDAVASEQSRSDNEASASTAAQSVSPNERSALRPGKEKREGVYVSYHALRNYWGFCSAQSKWDNILAVY